MALDKIVNGLANAGRCGYIENAIPPFADRAKIILPRSSPHATLPFPYKCIDSVRLGKQEFHEDNFGDLMFRDAAVQDAILEKAQTDSGYAIAFALLKVADALDRIGMNRGRDGMGGEAPGCLEKIAIALEEINNVPR